MDRSDATHVAIGSAFLGVGGVGLSILIPLAAAARPHPWTAAWFIAPACVAGVLGLAGFYMLLTIYTGWWLPPTASERAAVADLRVEAIEILSVYTTPETQVLFRVGLNNRARRDVTNATLNVLVPDFVRAICQSKDGGRIGQDSHAVTAESIQEDGAGNPIGSRYWNRIELTFPGRTAYPMDFRASLPTPQLFRVLVRVVSADLPDELVEQADLDPMPQVEQLSSEQASEKDGHDRE
jgi:hypothetical protein